MRETPTSSATTPIFVTYNILLDLYGDFGPPFGPTVDWENNFPQDATTGVGGRNLTTLSAGYPALTFFLKKV